MSSAPGQPVGPFRAYAHRGGAAEHPENSPTAFAHAVGLGYEFLETDVRPSRDGVAVLHHDATLDRTTDGHGLVRNQSWRHLRSLRLAEGSSPMRLEELLEAYPQATLNVDVKEPGSVTATLDAVSRCAAWTRVCVTSFARRRLQRMRRHTLATVTTAAVPSEVGAFRLAPGRLSPGLLSADRGPDRLQVPLRLAGRPLVDAAFVAGAHRVGLAVDVWTVDDARVMEELLELGVDGIMTDRPSVLRHVLQSRGRWPTST